MHRNSAGFMALPLAGYGAIAAILVIAAMGVAIKLEASRYEHLKQEYDAFRGGVEALGLAAKKAAAEKEAQDIKRKADTDALHQAAVDALNLDLRRLRSQRTSGGGLSAPAPSPDSVARTCFDPTKLAAALRALDDGVLGLVESGAKAVTDLDAAKAWAQGR